MKDQPFNDLEKFLDEELKKEEENIDEVIQSRPEIASARASDELRERIFQKIREMEEEEKATAPEAVNDEDKILCMLSEEDRESLLLGREMRKQKETEEPAENRKFIRKKKRVWKQIAVLAAAVGVIFAMGITSVGGPERVIDIIRQAVGSREMEVINSNSDSEEIMGSGEDNEEKAFQQIQDEFGIVAVRIVNKPDGLDFKGMQIDNQMQTIHMSYETPESNLSYVIDCSYNMNSFGVNVEDELLEEKEIELEKATGTLKTYKIKETGDTNFIVTFEYKKIYYTIATRLKWQDFKVILDNLHFF